MKKQGTLENRANYVYLALGSNLGNKISNLIKTQQLIIESNIQILKSSSFYKTESWPNKKFPFYVNSVILVKTSFNPIKLFNIIKSIEIKIGRKKAIKNHPRVCDIDIIDFNGQIIWQKMTCPQKIPGLFTLLHKIQKCQRQIYRLKKN